MPDDVVLNVGAGGDTIAADLIGTVKHQRVKVEFGVDGSATDVADEDGARLPVKIGSVAGAGSLVSGQQAVTAAAVALTANAVRKVTIKALMGNVIAVYVGPAGITIGTGYELAPNQSVTLNVNNTNLLFVIASTTGASICFVGHP